MIGVAQTRPGTGRFALPWRSLPILVLGVGVVVFAVTTPAFASVPNVLAIVNSATVTGIAAVGLTFVTLSGNFLPLSVEQAAATSAVTLALLISIGLPPLWAIAAAVLVGVLIGALQGFIVSLGGNPLMVTLAVGAVLMGVIATLTDSKTITVPAGTFGDVGSLLVFGIPFQTYVFVLVTVALTVYANRSRSGQVIRLLGENRLAAAASGLSVRGTTILAFGLAGLTISFVAVLSVMSFERANITQFSGLTFDAVAAVLVGGTAIRGGHGSPLRSAIGAVLIALLMNVMLLREWSFGWRLLIQGAIVIAAVAFYRLAAAGKETTS